jgi:hypothetical protein
LLYAAFVPDDDAVGDLEWRASSCVVVTNTVVTCNSSCRRRSLVRGNPG